MKNYDRNLLPWEIKDITKKKLEVEMTPLARKSLLGGDLAYANPKDYDVDEKESARDFLKSIEDFMERKANEIAATRKGFGLPAGLEKIEKSGPRSKNKPVKNAQRYVDQTAKISQTTLMTFVKSCLNKYEKAHIEPGTAIGAIGAQSIGEPGTQMTLKTFHFAGVANLHITQGVPRIKEIINASPTISTPIITCSLDNKTSEIAARVVKGRIEQTFLRDIIKYVEDVWSPSGSYVVFKVDMGTVEKLQLDIKTGRHHPPPHQK